MNFFEKSSSSGNSKSQKKTEKQNHIDEINAACKKLLEEHFVHAEGELPGLPRGSKLPPLPFPAGGKIPATYYFYRPSGGANYTKYSNSQWLWDNALQAVVASHFNVSSSILSIQSYPQFTAASGPALDGMFPETTYWMDRTARSRTPSTISTTGITR